MKLEHVIIGGVVVLLAWTLFSSWGESNKIVESKQHIHELTQWQPDVFHTYQHRHCVTCGWSQEAKVDQL